MKIADIQAEINRRMEGNLSIASKTGNANARVRAAEDKEILDFIEASLKKPSKKA